MNRLNRQRVQDVIDEAARRLTARFVSLAEAMLDKNGLTFADVELTPEEIVRYVTQNIMDGTLRTMATVVAPEQAAKQLSELKQAQKKLYPPPNVPTLLSRDFASRQAGDLLRGLPQ